LAHSLVDAHNPFAAHTHPLSGLLARQQSKAFVALSQERYKLDQLPGSVHAPAAEVQATTTSCSTPGPKAALTQQHAHKHRQQQGRIAAVKASAAAVQEWTSTQLERNTTAAAGPGSRAQAEGVQVTSRELGQLPPPVLQLLSTEAQHGLLHLQALRLLPPQLEVTRALIGAPGSECCTAAC
jgi:hypothetical protein